MRFCSILCLFGGTANEVPALHAACHLAYRHAAVLRVMTVLPKVEVYPLGVYEGLVVSDASLLEKMLEEQRKLGEKARQQVAAVVRQYQLPFMPEERPAKEPYVTFSLVHGDINVVLADEGRWCDLIVTGRQENVPVASHPALLTALFSTGRPVLLMPDSTWYQPGDWQDRNITLAWNNSLEAVRALHMALPLMRHAEVLNILTVRNDGDRHDFAHDRTLKEYLLLHGIASKAFVVERHDKRRCDVLLARAQVLKTDILLMGAWGHSRFREMLLGGMTHCCLEQATMPLLLAH